MDKKKQKTSGIPGTDALQQFIYTQTRSSHYLKFLDAGNNKFPLFCGINKSVPLRIPVINKSCEKIGCYADAEVIYKWLKDKQGKSRIHIHEYACFSCDKKDLMTDDLVCDIGLQYYIESFRRKRMNIKIRH